MGHRQHNRRRSLLVGKRPDKYDDKRIRNSGNVDNEAEALFSRREKVVKAINSDIFQGTVASA